MSLIKIIFLSFLLTLLSSNVLAKHSEFENEENIIVLKHNYSLDDCLNSSIANFHRVTSNLLYLQDGATLKLLEENAVITIPDIAQSRVVFLKNKFKSANFYPISSDRGTSLEATIKKVIEVRQGLNQISNLAIQQNTSDLTHLTVKNFEKKSSIIVDSYELENYKIALILKKSHPTKEVLQHKQDHFQLELIVDAKESYLS